MSFGYIAAAWLVAGAIVCFWLMIPEKDEPNPVIAILLAALWPLWVFLAVRGWWRGEPWPRKP
jgi:hypothetical protein